MAVPDPHHATGGPQIVDAYTHCGVSHYKPVEEVLQALDGARVARAVLVQHLGEFDNSYIADVVRASPDRFTGVCLVDPAAGDAVAVLDTWLATGCFRGVRLQLQHLAAHPALFHAAAERNIHIVLCTIGGLTDHLPDLHGFLDVYPNCSLTLSHWGWPRAVDAPDFEPYAEVLDLAEYPGVVLQLSGLGMFAPDAPSVFERAVDLAFDRFGPYRMVWGSNFPVSGGDAAGYYRELAQFLTGEIGLPAAVLPAVLGENALQMWFPSGAEDE